MKKKAKGSLIIIGGHEDKSPNGQRVILREVAGRADNGCLVIVTAATRLPDVTAEDYRKVFRDLGVQDVRVLDVRSRPDAFDESLVKIVQDASVIFFTGGDQLRITSQMGYSPVLNTMLNRYEEHGITIAGTSAGAAAMPETMLISGPGRESNAISAIGMAPGLGLVHGVVIDSHFAERGRFSRLLGAVAQNPYNLGLGIDENTAIVTEEDHILRVIGSGAVYVVDGSHISYSSLSEASPEGVFSIFDVKMHVLGKDARFDFKHRQPIGPRGTPVAPLEVKSSAED